MGQECGEMSGQIPLFSWPPPETAVPHHDKVQKAFQDALLLWYRHATEIKPEATGYSFRVAMPDGRVLKVSMEWDENLTVWDGKD